MKGSRLSLNDNKHLFEESLLLTNHHTSECLKKQRKNLEHEQPEKTLSEDQREQKRHKMSS
jgi:hypothetical protein